MNQIISRLKWLDTKISVQFNNQNYELEARVLLILIYRVLGIDGLFTDQTSLIAKGYFSDLYRSLGICKALDSEIFAIFTQYRKAFLKWVDPYFVIVYGFHWFESENPDEFLAIADEVLAANGFDAGDKPQIESQLWDDFQERIRQKDQVAHKLDGILKQYQVPCTNQQKEKLICDLGFSFYMSDEEEEPQTNLYLYRSHALYQLQELDHSSETRTLFAMLYRAGMWLDRKEAAICYAGVQEYGQDNWILVPSVLYALCVLTVKAKSFAACEFQMAICQDDVWYEAYCQKRRKNG